MIAERGGERPPAAGRRRALLFAALVALIGAASSPARAAAGAGASAAAEASGAAESEAAEISAPAAQRGAGGGPCEAPRAAMATGPLQVAVSEGELFLPRRACPRAEIYGGLAGAALIDTPAFFGTLSAGVSVGGSFPYARGGEVFAVVGLLHYRFVQNATLTGSQLGPGTTSAGATHPIFRGENIALAATARLTLPTALGTYENAWPLYAGAGLALSYRVAPRLRAHGQLGALGGLTLGRGPLAPRGAIQSRAGLSFEFGRAAAVADAGADFGYGAPLDRAYVAPGFRLAPWRQLAAEAAIMLPFAGADRSDAALSLRAAWRYR